MSLQFADRVKETSATTGTGTIDLLGASTGFQSFVNGIGSGNTCHYCINDGANWEVGLGTVTNASPDTLSRDIVYASSTGGSKINWVGVGPRDVFVTIPAAHQQFITMSHTFSSASVSTVSTISATVAHGVATDNFDFGFTMIGSVNNNIAGGVMTPQGEFFEMQDSANGLQIFLTETPPVTGNLRFRIYNYTQVQDVTFNVWMRAR